MAERDGSVRVWVPVFEHSVRTGVLALTVDDAAPEVIDRCRSLGLLAGLLVASASRYTDLMHVRKRGRSMSVAASMQWDLLPPLTVRTEQVVVAGMLEPAYEVAGDCFDQSVNGDRVDVAVFDGMGHGIGSTLLSTLAVGTYRHQRREHRDLATTHATIDTRGDPAVRPGRLRDRRPRPAGHPHRSPRADQRGSSRAAAAAGPPAWSASWTAMPACPSAWGARSRQPLRFDLQPGDTVVLYTDGVVEARGADGSEFGVHRLRDLLEREAASELPLEDVLRRLVRTVLEHQGGPLRDDATLVLMRGRVRRPRSSRASRERSSTPRADLAAV